MCIDADIGLRNLDVVMGLESRIVFDLVDVVEGRCGLRQALVRDKRVPHLYLLPASQTHDKTAVSPQEMIALTNQLRADYDFVLIDSPAGIEWGFRNALAPADEVIVITNPEIPAVRDADRIIGVIEAEERPIALGVVINRAKPDMIRRGEMMSVADVLEVLAVRLLGIVPEDSRVTSASNNGAPMTLEYRNAPVSRAFVEIARRLLGEDIPIRDPAGEGVLLRMARRLRWGR